MADITIEVASHAGVCYGVERALKLAREAAMDGEVPVHTLGPLIHNPIVVDELASSGVLACQGVDEVDDGTLVIRAHGVVPQVIERAADKGLQVIDATCPYVKKVHLSAEMLVREGYQLVVVGESGHPEVEGIMGHADASALVVSSSSDLEGAVIGRKVGVVVQTTQTPAVLSEVVDALMPRVRELRVINTICSATQERQDSAAELAGRVDVMLVVGGRNSGNTRRLFQICSSRCASTHHIESADEVDPSWFSGASRIGVTAGASTPASHIDGTVAAVRARTGA